MLVSLLMAVPAFATNLRWHWEDPFSPAERAKLVRWISTTQQAIESLTAPLPFPVHLHVYRLPDRGEPVPWANTRRGARQGIDLHVDPGWPLDAFLEDWTAAHELSHLLLPYLGSRHSWFAEGFASYLQYQVLAHQGVISDREAGRAYREKIEHAAASYRDYDLDESLFLEATTRLRRQRAYPVYYWGGAVYFMTVDAQLEASAAPRLTALLADYLACCRHKDETLADVLASLDRLSGTTLLTATLADLKQRRGFPAYEAALAWFETTRIEKPGAPGRNKAGIDASNSKITPGALNP